MTGPTFDVNTGVRQIDQVVNEYLGDAYFEGISVPANYGNSITSTVSIVWVIGFSIILIYALAGFLRLHKKVSEAVLLQDNVWVADTVNSPFILGIVSPKIYVSFGAAENHIDYILAHEQAHIKRKDHIWKFLGYLLCCSMQRKLVIACPLAFGEVAVKERVKSVMKYKKPAFWLLCVSVMVCIIVAVCFLTNPVTSKVEGNVNSMTTHTADVLYSDIDGGEIGTNVEDLVSERDYDIGEVIDNIILNGPQTSSNPFDYVNASKKEFDYLINNPKETYEYAISDLICSNAGHGLRSYIEALLCSEINTRFVYDFESASDYLEHYKEFLLKSDSEYNDYDTYALSLIE